MSKGKYSISVSQGRVAHDHDNRDYTPHNADRGLRNRNVIIKQTEDYKSAFNELFRDSIEAYNAKQKREDRKKSYHKHILLLLRRKNAIQGDFEPFRADQKGSDKASLLLFYAVSFFSSSCCLSYF